ncbi:hypothetical protein ACJX0J_013301, partial [Zea mays]
HYIFYNIKKYFLQTFNIILVVQCFLTYIMFDYLPYLCPIGHHSNLLYENWTFAYCWIQDNFHRSSPNTNLILIL